MVDIIIPTIDDPRFLNKALTSIENTCQIDKIHIYIISDNSKYDYDEVIANHNKLDIHYIKSNESIGPGPARNLGIKAGKGKWVAFLDCDDEYVDDVCRYCNDNYDYILTEIINECKVYSEDSDQLISGIHGLLLQRTYMEKYNLFFPNIKYGAEDTVFRTACFMISDNYKIINKSYYLFKDNPQSNFMHHKTPDYIFNTDCYIDQQINATFWPNIFYNYLHSLKCVDELSKNENWNIVLLKVLSTYFWEDEVEYNAIYFYLIISDFLYLSQVKNKKQFKNLPLTFLSYLSFVSLFFEKDGDWIIFNPIKDINKYKDFVLKYKTLLPKNIVNNFIYYRKKFYSVSYLNSLTLKYYTFYFKEQIGR